MATKSAQAEELILKVQRLTKGDFNPALVVQTLRDDNHHVMADLVESMADQIVELWKRLGELEGPKGRPKRKRK